MARASGSAIAGQVRGRIGGEVLVGTRGGTALRRRPQYRYPEQASVQEGQERMALAMQAWNGLTREQAMLWNAYADTLRRRDPVDGRVYAPTGHNVFASLACKLLQVSPGAPVPTAPPVASFAGDDLTVTLSGGAGQVVFTASGPNTPPALTELLLQPLKSARRTPGPFYRSAAFVSFAGGALEHAVPLAPGWYAGAFRFVSSATGQMTTLVTLGVVEVV